MIAVLLCAGYATRLYPLTKDFPKSLLPVAGRPLIDYLITQLTGFPGLNAIHIITNNRFFRHFDEWQRTWTEPLRAAGMAIALHNDGSTQPSRKLGALADLNLVLQAEPRSEGFLAAAGDNIFLFDLLPLWMDFLQGQSHLVVALNETDPCKLRQTGVAVLSSDGRLLRLDEKPSHPASTLIIPPLYFLQADARDHLYQYLTGGGEKDAPGHFIAYLCRKQAVFAKRLDAKRLHIGDPNAYRKAQDMMGNRWQA